MGSKNITISDDAYKFLKGMKGENKSFSDVILSIKGKGRAVMEYAGALKNADLASVETVREEMRKDWTER